jgi:hypothetical protein
MGALSAVSVTEVAEMPEPVAGGTYKPRMVVECETHGVTEVRLERQGNVVLVPGVICYLCGMRMRVVRGVGFSRKELEG